MDGRACVFGGFLCGLALGGALLGTYGFTYAGWKTKAQAAAYARVAAQASTGDVVAIICGETFKQKASPQQAAELKALDGHLHAGFISGIVTIPGIEMDYLMATDCADYVLLH